jgi:redox-sensitive bicupin YhaK (pirin superfamily)
VLVLEGAVTIDGVGVAVAHLGVLPVGRDHVRFTSSGPTRVLLLGGAPYTDPLHMWWNFVGGSRDEIDHAVDDWNAGRRFGEVLGSGLARIPSPLPAWRTGSSG